MGAMEFLKELPSESVDCIVTSPPYWALRDYGVDGQLGLEPTFQEYINKLCTIFDEAKRVLKKEGTCWVNMGDTYSSNTKEDDRDPEKQREKRREGIDINSDKCFGRHSKEWFESQHQQGVRKIKRTIPEKCLCQIPSRFAIEMTNRGWILRNEIIWFKPNCMPSSAGDRFTVDFEKLFFFTKSKKYYFEQQLEPYTNPLNRWGGTMVKQLNGADEYGMAQRIRDYRPNSKGKNKRCVWQINTKPFPGAHFAVYPQELVKTPIEAGCPEGGIVLDMFMGSWTTARVAKDLGRNFLGCDLNPEYCLIGKKRLSQQNLI